MNQISKVTLTIMLTTLSWAAISANKPTTKPERAVTIEALSPDGQLSSVNTPFLVDSHGFEASEGFSLGFLGGQAGWTVFANSSVEPTIDNSNPASGSQHFRMAEDTSISWGTDVGGFSPDLGPQPAGVENRVNADFMISSSGGSDYYLIGQAPSLTFATWNVNFDWQGNIFVADDLGGGFAYEDTGVAWPVNSYFNFEVVTNPGGTAGVEYYLDGTLIWTQTTMLSASDNVEQVVFYNDNFQFGSGETADMDNLMIDTDAAGQPPTPAMPVPGLGTFGIILLSLGLLWTVRRKWVLS
ncbi:hypothetical protein GCM10023308_13220 [Marinicella pacifica]|uniref:hypothetical protein n=1 Tax=Marinicella pacifica TaxID=1171543 RepID=UPI00166371BA|nr:hypothetical protein [Marinicella pacifica]